MSKNLFSADGKNHLIEFKPIKEKRKSGPAPILTDEQKKENKRVLNANYRAKNQEKMKALKSEWYKNNSDYAKKKAKEKYKSKVLNNGK